MMLLLTGDIDITMFEKLLNGLNNLKKDDNLCIWISSGGGEVAIAEAMIELINLNKEYISVFFFNEVYSATMTIFLKLQCKKHVVPETIGMYHLSYLEISMKEGVKPSTEFDKFSYSDMKESIKNTIPFLEEKKFTKNEIKTITKGKDLFLSYKRLLELLNG